ncbi:MAG: NAD-binding protein [Clostridiales bacterium]
MYIIIVGAGKAGYYLTKTLMDENHEVTLVDWNFDRVKKLEMDLGDSIIYASGSSIDGLDLSGCSRADIVIALTGDDEDNLVICQLGSQYFGVKKTIARINNPKNSKIFKILGMGTVVSGIIAISEIIDNYVTVRKS